MNPLLKHSHDDLLFLSDLKNFFEAEDNKHLASILLDLSKQSDQLTKAYTLIDDLQALTLKIENVMRPL